jgi:hypothetical protein
MTRVFKYKNFGVYIGDARGEPHHLPHAHIKERGRPVCSVSLYSLEPLQRGKRLPPGMLEELKSHQEEMLEEWERLNPDERE